MPLKSIVVLVSFCISLIIYSFNAETINCKGGSCSCQTTPSSLGETCILHCDKTNVCKGQTLYCRAGDPCIIQCEASGACSDGTTIHAETATDVTIICNGDDACNINIDIKCGTGDCRLQCNTDKSCTDWGHIDTTISSSFDCIGHCPDNIPSLFTPSPTLSPNTITSDPTPFSDTTNPSNQIQARSSEDMLSVVNPLYYIIAILIIGCCCITILLLFGLYLHHKRTKEMLDIIEKQKGMTPIQSKSHNFTHSEFNPSTLPPMPSPITSNPLYSYSIKYVNDIDGIHSPPSHINMETNTLDIYTTPSPRNNNHNQTAIEIEQEHEGSNAANNDYGTIEILQHIMLNSKSNKTSFVATPNRASAVCLPGQSGVKSDGRPRTSYNRHQMNQMNQTQIGQPVPIKPLTPWDIMNTANSCSSELKTNTSSPSSYTKQQKQQSFNSNSSSLPPAFYAHSNAVNMVQTPQQLELLHIIDSMDAAKPSQHTQIAYNPYNPYNMNEMNETSDAASSDAASSIDIERNNDNDIVTKEDNDNNDNDNDNDTVSNSSTSELSISFSITNTTKTGNNGTQKVLEVVNVSSVVHEAESTLNTECKLMENIQFKQHEKDRMDLEDDDDDGTKMEMSSITIMTDNDNSDNTPEPNQYDDGRRDTMNTVLQNNDSNISRLSMPNFIVKSTRL